MSTDLRPAHYGADHHPEMGRLKAEMHSTPSGAPLVRLLEHNGERYRQMWAGLIPETAYAERLVAAINDAPTPSAAPGRPVA